MYPIPIFDKIRIIIEIVMCKGFTVLMAMRANIAIGEQNGIKDKIFISSESTLPEMMLVIGTINAITIRNVSGVVSVLRSSVFEAREPNAP